MIFYIRCIGLTAEYPTTPLYEIVGQPTMSKHIEILHERSPTIANDLLTSLASLVRWHRWQAARGHDVTAYDFARFCQKYIKIRIRIRIRVRIWVRIIVNIRVRVRVRVRIRVRIRVRVCLIKIIFR